MSSKSAGDRDALLTPGEVAALFRVDPKTVTRWAQDGRLSSVRTLGGHRRFRADEVYALLRGSMTSVSGLAQDPGQGHSA
jgi:excisionase family DNA binding protein